MQHNLAAGSAEGYASCCEALAVADVRAQLPEIRLPVLVIAGSADPVTTVDDGQAMQAAIPACQLHEIAASHISNIERPDDFTQALQGFLQAL